MLRLDRTNIFRMEEQDIYEEAQKRVKAKKGFFYHFLAYAFVVGILYAIMYFTTDNQMLPVILLALSWGIGIAIHYFKVFGTENLEILGLNPRWEEKELENEIRKLKKRRALKEELINEKKLLDQIDDTLELKELQKRRLDENAS